MKRNVRNILILVALALTIVTIVVVRRNSRLQGVEAVIEKRGRYALLSERELDSMVYAYYPALDSMKIKELESKHLRRELERCMYIEKVETDVTTGGTLRVKAILREPVVRMFYQGNEFYLSRDGRCMPLSKSHYCHLPIGSSEWKEARVDHISQIALNDSTNEENREGLKKIWSVGCFISEQSRYEGVFDQIHLTEEGDLVLVPKLGDFVVELGNEVQLERKFENLWILFDQGINQVGWDAYKKISVKYNNQVVCTRK